MAGGLDRTRRDSYPSRYGTTGVERKSNVQLDAKLRDHRLRQLARVEVGRLQQDIQWRTWLGSLSLLGDGLFHMRLRHSQEKHIVPGYRPRGIITCASDDP
jgi:hypothetical protein